MTPAPLPPAAPPAPGALALTRPASPQKTPPHITTTTQPPTHPQPHPTTRAAQILRKYIYGGHVGEYMEEMIEEDPEKYQASNRLLIAHVSSRLCPSPGLRPSLTAP